MDIKIFQQKCPFQNENGLALSKMKFQAWLVNGCNEGLFVRIVHLAVNSPWLCRKFPENIQSCLCSHEQKFDNIPDCGNLFPIMLKVILNISLIAVQNLPGYKMQILAILLQSDRSILSTMVWNEMPVVRCGCIDTVHSQPSHCLTIHYHPFWFER